VNSVKLHQSVLDLLRSSHSNRAALAFAENVDESEPFAGSDSLGLAVRN